MNSVRSRIRKAEFEYRIFISLGIAFGVYALSATLSRGAPSIGAGINRTLGFPSASSLALSFGLIGVQMIVSSLLRMWAGSLLTPQRVMSFVVRTDRFISSGPYLLSRNPIYLADFWAMSSFAFCLPPIGLLLPLLFYLHYRQLILYEEESLGKNSHPEYDRYLRETPRLFPNLRSLRAFLKNAGPVRITREGFRHNALYLMFVPGFAAAAVTGEFTLALLVGLPAVLDWAVVHTRIGGKKRSVPSLPKRSKQKKVFDDILYAQCWEDPRTDRTALRIAPDDVLFSITSGGDNVLAFLIDNPARVIALDLNPHQTYLLELKMRAYECFDYGTMLEFLGVRPSRRRGELYLRLRDALSGDARAFWDARPNLVAGGVLHCGRYERYMKLVRWGVRLCVGRRVIERCLALEDAGERERLYDEKWDTLRWRFCTRVLLSRKVMSLLFDPAFFAQLESRFSFGAHFAEKARHALTRLPARENPFLNYILLGHFSGEQHLPLCLRREHYRTIQSRLERIEPVTGDCAAYFRQLPTRSIDKFNFSNIFEWMPADAFESLLRDTLRVAKRDAVVVYRNLLVRRARPAALAGLLQPREKLAEALNANDLSFIYDTYVIEQVITEKTSCSITSPSYRTAAA